MSLALPREQEVKRRLPSALVYVALAHLVLEFTNNYLPVLYPRIAPALGLSFAQIGVIALVSSTAYSLTLPVFGYFSDRGNPVWIVSLSVLWIGVAMGLVGLAPSYATLLLLVALGGLGSAAFHPPATIVAAANSGERRGSGLSVFSVGGNVGAALSPLWMAFAVGALGLAGTLTILPVALVFGVLFFIQMRRSMALSSVSKSSSSASSLDSFLLGMILIICAMMFRSWYQVAFMTYLPTWVEGSGGSLSESGRLLAVFLFSISAGSVLGGVSSDRFGPLAVLIVALATLPLFHWAAMQSTGVTQLTMIGLAGVAVGCTFPTSIVLVLDAWPHQAGVATGLLMGLGWWPGGLGASLTGVLADAYSLTAALSILAFVPLFGLGCLLLYAVADRARRRSNASS